MSPHRSVIMDALLDTHCDILDVVYAGGVAQQRRQRHKILPERWDIGAPGLEPNWDPNCSYRQQILHNQYSSSSSLSSYLPQVLVAHRVQVMSVTQPVQIVDIFATRNPSPMTPASDVRSCWSVDEPSLAPDETTSQLSNPVTILDIYGADDAKSEGVSTPEDELDIDDIYSIFIQSVDFGVAQTPDTTRSPTLFDSSRTFALRSFDSLPKVTVSADHHTLPTQWFFATSPEAAFTQSTLPFCPEQVARACGYSPFLARSMRPTARSEEGGFHRRRTKLPRRAYIWGLKTMRALRRQVGGWVTGVPPHLYA